MTDYQLAKDVAYIMLDLKNINERLKALEEKLKEK